MGGEYPVFGAGGPVSGRAIHAQACARASRGRNIGKTGQGQTGVASVQVIRGFLSGLIWGLLLVGLALVVLSLSLPLPLHPRPTAPVEPAPVSMSVPQQAVQPAETPQSEPALVAPALETAPVVLDGTAAIRPQAEMSGSTMVDPVAEGQAPQVSAPSDAPLGTGATAGLSVPIAEAEPSISTDPAQPMAPEEQASALEDAVLMPEMSDTEADALLAEALEAAMAGPETAPEAQTEAAQPAAPEAEGDAPNVPAAPADPKFPPDAPVVVNAEPFLNADALPLMSIVLIDTGAFNIGAEALATFPYPLTFAVDPLREDAVAVMQGYRDAGFEVLAVTDLPADVNPDVAGLTLPPMLDGLPGVVGMLEGTGTGLQGDMQLAEAVLDVVADSHYGLVLRPKGLNAAQSQATGRGLPVATVFRDFDASGQDAAVIRRFLDQAAFRARQQGGVIMVGRVRPATISALLLWGLQDRAGSVALAPISAILTE